jgi:hypothetical protein
MTFASHVLPAALLFAVAGAAFAADAPAKAEAKPEARKERSLGGTGKATGAFLTRDELRTCFAREAKTKARDAELVKERDAIALQKGEITRSGEALEARLPGVDRSNAEAVAAHNDAVQARSREIDAYQARVTAFNDRIEAGQAERAAFGQQCSNRRYFEEDEVLIRLGK